MGIKFILADPYAFFLKLLYISIGKIVHVRDTHAEFYCGLNLCSDHIYNSREFHIYLRLN